MPNNTATASASSGGIGIFGLAFIAMFVFKLADIAGASWGLDIPWVVVFLPVIFGFVVTLVVLAIVVLAAIFSD